MIDEHLPQRRRGRRIGLALVVAALAAAAVITAFLWSPQAPPQHHVNCSVEGKVYFPSAGRMMIDSSNCGLLSYDATVAQYEALRNSGDRYDFETRGYIFGFPPEPRVVNIAYLGPADF